MTEINETEAEMKRLSAVEIKSVGDPIKGSVSAITGSLRQMGLLNEQQAAALNVVTGSLTIINGLLGLMAAKTAMNEVKNKVLEAESVALTTAATAEGFVTFGAAWGKIALATAIAGATSVAIYTAINNIDLGAFNLSTAEGQQSAATAVKEAI